MRVLSVFMLLCIGVLVVLWYQGNREVQAWYDSVEAYNKLHAKAAAVVQPRPKADFSKMMEVASPHKDEILGHAFTIEGKARGGWYDEGFFPIEVQNENGVVLGAYRAEALSSWTTPDFVEFEVDVTVPYYSGPAKVVLKKANPSGLPENDAEIVVPVRIQ